MATHHGVWHKTTVEAAREQQQTYQTANLAGLKRASDGTWKQPAGGATPSLRTSSHFERASSLSKEPSRLTASTIRVVDGASWSEPGDYTQRQAISATPTSTVDPLLSLSHRLYGLPPVLVHNLASLGIKTIYPWQKQCLLGPGLLQGDKNLVYSAPTGGGKSLVADILMLKGVLADRGAKALLVLPYVALVQEKVRWLRNVVQGISLAAIHGQSGESENKLWRKRADEDTIRVVGFFGGSKIRSTWQDFDIGVCTIEKANSLVNTAIEDCSISSLKTVVLDELHMVDDDHRGYLLELMATKLLCLDQAVQIVGMSATLTNINLLARWLHAHSYETHYRPIPIEEHLAYDGKIYAAATARKLSRLAPSTQSKDKTTIQVDADPLRLIDRSDHKELQESVVNAVVALANETVRAGFGALVFSSSRAMCESDALLISRVLPSQDELDPLTLDRRLDLLGDLRSLNTGLDANLEKTIPYGVAFHHAGMTTEERDLVANAYDAGVLKVCVATCSLAAGINLPARRVILHSARMGRDLVGPSMLRQMRGRAGRKGKDEVGETYLCCRPGDLDGVVELIHSDLPEISSCLSTDQRKIQRAVLEIIAIRLATSHESLNDYIIKTLLYQTADRSELRTMIAESLDELQRLGFITRDEDAATFQATQLGHAIVASALDPEDGVFIHKELRRALKAFVMDGELHVLYTFTPVNDTSVNINWRIFWNEMENLDESGLRVLSFVGLKPSVISRMVHGGTFKESTPEEKEVARIYRRFYLALQLRDLCNEMPIHRVAKKYDVPRGAVQNLAQTCQGFAAGMIKFCQQMGWGAMAATLDHFSDRLKAGAKDDLLALAKITFIKSRTARVFWDNGFKTVAAVANADPQELVPILMQAQPNKLRLQSKDETKYAEKLLAKAQVITDSANRLWQIEMQLEIEEE
ncbi:uncharacterized protein E0L32_000610 [Thyridium curvatum]|uniref:Uncharacterized protein n=1 Tax=Thyridium curvatum TaxID=1093900 RepID=A0A507B545_9PEZI|nr:uncharacterized protein E0L32_000610 [Thyridium curvatum]TPX14216.1 hypothetical protein E0L32_000610 [Thyridium curvatum]